MPCSEEISGLPILTGCPGNSEYFFMVGASSGKGAGGYALRSAADVKSCFLSGVKFGFVQIVVGVTKDGDGNIIMGNTSTQLIISQAGVISFSVRVSSDGSEMPIDADGVAQAYYGSVINPTNLTVNFIQPFGDNSIVIVHYAYIN